MNGKLKKLNAKFLVTLNTSASKPFYLLRDGRVTKMKMVSVAASRPGRLALCSLKFQMEVVGRCNI